MNEVSSSEADGQPAKSAHITGTDDEEYEEVKEEVGVASIKKEFLIRRPKISRNSAKESANDAVQNDSIAPINGSSDSKTDDTSNLSSEGIDAGQKRKAGSEEAPSKKMKGQFKNRPVDKSARDPSMKLCNRSAVMILRNWYLVSGSYFICF